MVWYTRIYKELFHVDLYRLHRTILHRTDHVPYHHDMVHDMVYTFADTWYGTHKKLFYVDVYLEQFLYPTFNFSHQRILHGRLFGISISYA